MSSTYLKDFGESWYNALKPFIDGNTTSSIDKTITEKDTFSSIDKTMGQLRKTKIVYPERELIFRAFRETSLDEVKVILLFQDPYHNGIMDGLATSCSRSFISPTLRIMLNEIDKEYPELKLFNGIVKEGDNTFHLEELNIFNSTYEYV